MPSGADQSLGDVLAFLITSLVVLYALWTLLRRLGRTRSDLAIFAPIAAALVLRVLMAAAISLTPFGESLRGGDEEGVVFFGRELGSSPFTSSEWADALTHQLFEFIVAIQEKLLASPELALRVTEAGIAVAGIALLATAVYELAGARAATVAAWLLAFEPTGVFFSTLIHKEALMMLAAGLVAYGGALLWTRETLRPLVPIALGCVIAACTRGYASWFLIAAGALIALHASLRARNRSSTESLVLVGLVVVVAAITVPRALEASSDENLAGLQYSQDVNASDQSNLSLERVDYSTRGALITNLPIRIRDVTLRPYPWQVGSVSQQFGLLGTLAAYLALILLIRICYLRWGSIMERAGPLIYTGSMLLIAYSLSAGNAGTAFRYRTHVMMLGICIVVVLWMGRTETVAETPARRKPRPLREPVPIP
jgi:hypothetical protein